MIADILINISKYLGFHRKIRLKKCNKILDQKIKIYNLDNFNYKLTDDIIKNYPNLKYLRLENRYKGSNEITDKSIKYLSKLRVLNLSSNHIITDEGIKNLINLKSLNLYLNENITDEGIKNLSKLEMLDISGNMNITNYGIQNLLNLKELHLIKNSIITDDGIKKLYNLEILDLWRSKKITDEGIKNLSKLRYIDLRGTRISQEMIDKLKSRGCIMADIFWNPPKKK